ncbi:Anaerobic nitric oxide reductase flavorubredoxin [anaerobic digester metagenome]|jgi:rubredoxin
MTALPAGTSSPDLLIGVLIPTGLHGCRAPIDVAAGRGGEVKEMMDSYRCGLCGYVYNPRAGEPGQGIEARTEFGDLPENWACSRCGAEKNLFRKA